jgi:hypothetical protein
VNEIFLSERSDLFGLTFPDLPSPNVAKAVAADTANNKITASFLHTIFHNVISVGWFIVYKNKNKKEYKTNRLSRTLVLH